VILKFQVISNSFLKFKTSFRFGHEKRNDLRSKSCIGFPGPGQYQHKLHFGKEGPRISVGKEKRGKDSRPKTPGPGHYEFSSVNKEKAPIYTISKVRPKTGMPNNKTPGPGTYNSGLSHRPSTPSYR